MATKKAIKTPVKLTDEQMNVLKDLMEISGKFADQVLHIMNNHGLDKVDGCGLNIAVTPEFLFTTESVSYGVPGSDSGYVLLTKGRRCLNEKFEPCGENSPEYEALFAREEIRERMAEIVHHEKPLPPDGLWISRFDDPCDVDSGWSVT